MLWLSFGGTENAGPISFVPGSSTSGVRLIGCLEKSENCNSLSVEAVLDQMLNKIDDLCAERDRLRGQPL